MNERKKADLKDRVRKRTKERLPTLAESTGMPLDASALVRQSGQRHVQLTNPNGPEILMSNSIDIRPADRPASLATEKQQSLKIGCSDVECEQALRDGHEYRDHTIEWADTVRIALVAIPAALVWFRMWELFAPLSPSLS
jgi:hypothetical protein